MFSWVSNKCNLRDKQFEDSSTLLLPETTRIFCVPINKTMFVIGNSDIGFSIFLFCVFIPTSQSTFVFWELLQLFVFIINSRRNTFLVWTFLLLYLYCFLNEILYQRVFWKRWLPQINTMLSLSVYSSSCGSVNFSSFLIKYWNIAKIVNDIPRGITDALNQPITLQNKD